MARSAPLHDREPPVTGEHITPFPFVMRRVTRGAVNPSWCGGKVDGTLEIFALRAVADPADESRVGILGDAMVPVARIAGGDGGKSPFTQMLVKTAHIDAELLLVAGSAIDRGEIGLMREVVDVLESRVAVGASERLVHR